MNEKVEINFFKFRNSIRFFHIFWEVCYLHRGQKPKHFKSLLGFPLIDCNQKLQSIFELLQNISKSSQRNDSNEIIF